MFDFYTAGMEYILKLNKSGIFFKEFYSSVVLTKMLTFDDPGYVDLRSPAGVGIGAILYNYNGKIYASDEGRMLAEMGDDTFCIGHLDKNSFIDVFTSDKLLNPLEDSITTSAPMCNDCAFESYCGADPTYHYATSGDFLGKKPLSGFCNRNMKVFKYLLKLYRSDEQVKNIFHSWIS